MNLTVQQVRNSVKKLIDEKGEDFRYAPEGTGPGGQLTSGEQECFNVPITDEIWDEIFLSAGLDGSESHLRGYELPAENDSRRTTGCIVGEVLRMRGFKFASNMFNGGVYSDGIADNFTQEALNYAGSLQKAQDGGSTWGEAVVIAEERLKEYRS